MSYRNAEPLSKHRAREALVSSGISCCHVHLDPVGGLAGDMFIAAMLDAFPDSLDACLRDLEDSGVLEHVDISLQSGKSHGMAVARFCVTLKTDEPAASGKYRNLKASLQASALSQEVLERALAIFELLAQAESQVHGVALADVHFHEIADWDSVADIVAAASVIERNNVGSWSCSPLPTGSGLVDTQHGKLPVPAPATLVLLEGLATWDDGEPGERVTPTGAAIARYLSMRCLADCSFERRPSGVGTASGMGAGQRSLQQRPNIVRCAVYDLQKSSEGFDHTLDQVAELNFAIDDMTPEELSVAMDNLRQANGVIDVTHATAYGKKGRVMFDIRVLCRPECEPEASRLCFLETSTLGIRLQRVTRRVLKRKQVKLECPDTAVSAKLAKRPDIQKDSWRETVKVENDDIRQIPGLQARRDYASRLAASLECGDNNEFEGADK